MSYNEIIDGLLDWDNFSLKDWILLLDYVFLFICFHILFMESLGLMRVSVYHSQKRIEAITLEEDFVPFVDANLRDSQFLGFISVVDPLGVRGPPPLKLMDRKPVEMVAKTFKVPVDELRYIVSSFKFAKISDGRLRFDRERYKEFVSKHHNYVALRRRAKEFSDLVSNGEYILIVDGEKIPFNILLNITSKLNDVFKFLIFEKDLDPLAVYEYPDLALSLGIVIKVMQIDNLHSSKFLKKKVERIFGAPIKYLKTMDQYLTGRLKGFEKTLRERGKHVNKPKKQKKTPPQKREHERYCIEENRVEETIQKPPD